MELWPTCVVVPAGHRIGLTVRGRDYEHRGLRGCGPFLHDDPRDRPAATLPRSAPPQEV